MIGEKAGNVTIREKLGEGGMGAVYLGDHDNLGSQFAVKVLLPRWTQSPTIVQRFRNEAVAMGALKHPNIVAVTDCGQLANGSWYITMEYLSGRTLKQVGNALGVMSIHLTLQILSQVAVALEVAHKRKIVHRDLKPDNIFTVAEAGNSFFVKLMDWGISKLGEQDANAVTGTGMVAGTPAYMAPEQMRDLRTVDHRADIYALGVIAYQMITGGWFPYQRADRPEEFKQLSAPAIYELQVHGKPLDPRQHVATIPEGWWSAIRAAIDPDPARRPQSAAEFIRLLAAVTPGDGYADNGTKIVTKYAPALFDLGNLDTTYRAPAGTPKTTSRYRIEGLLGAGGMAEVFRATFVGAEGVTRPVAIKRVHRGFSDLPQFASMFVQEAQLASLLQHPNIVSVLDFDRDEDQRLFLVMEFVEGRDLSHLAATGPLPVSVIVFVVTEMLHGLGYAHDLPTADGPKGVIHRDVSPQNVLLSWEGAVKVSDFGIAKARMANDATASTMVKGKPQYMSPEQANGEPLDGRSDLFAVGIIMWELLAGRRLFDGTTEQALLQISTGQIPPPSSVRAGVAPELEAITMRLLARDRSQRYANAREVIRALASCASPTGKTDLIQMLCDRFPEALAARTRSPSQPSLPATVRHTPPQLAPTQKDRSPQPTPPGAWPSPTTLGAAAGQPSAVGGRSRAPLIVACAAAVVVGFGGALVGVAMRKHSATPGSSNSTELATPNSSTPVVTTPTHPTPKAEAPSSLSTAVPAESAATPSVPAKIEPTVTKPNVAADRDPRADARTKVEPPRHAKAVTSDRTQSTAPSPKHSNDEPTPMSTPKSLPPDAGVSTPPLKRPVNPDDVFGD